jgi:hypothetical protein
MMVGEIAAEDISGDLNKDTELDLRSNKRVNRFIPPDRKQRSDVTANSIEELIDDWWHSNTRPTANKANVKSRQIGRVKVTHHVQWLEDTVRNFFK